MSGVIEQKEDEEMEHDIDELWFITECVFCKKNLTTQSEINVSKLLQCLHAVCNNCVNTWNENEEKTCPVCSIPSSKLEIRENKVLCEMVSENEIPDVEGKVCNIHDAPVSHWCANCAEFICEECVKSHGQLKSTRDHSITTKDEHINSITVGEPKSVFPCTIHPQNQLTIVCHTCHAMTCRDCQLELHRDHKYDFVTDKIEETKKEVYKFFQKIEYHSIVLTSALDKISVREKKLEELKMKLISQIKDVFDIIIDLIRKRCKELMLSAVSKTNEKLAECSAGRTELEKDLNSLKLCLTFVKTVLYKSSDPVIFYTKDLMLSHMDRIRTKSRVPHAMDLINLRFVPANLQELKNGIHNFGKLDEMSDTSELDKSGYWKNVFQTLMNSYSDQLGISAGIKQTYQQQMWQQIVQFYHHSQGRQVSNEDYRSKDTEKQSQTQPQKHVQQMQQKIAQQLQTNAQQQKQLAIKMENNSQPTVAQQQLQQEQNELHQQQFQQQQKLQQQHHQKQLQQQQQHQLLNKIHHTQQIQQNLMTLQQQVSLQQQQQQAHQQQVHQQQQAHQQQLWQHFRPGEMSPPQHQPNPILSPVLPSSSPVSQSSPLSNNSQVVILPLGPQRSNIQVVNRVGQQPQQAVTLSSCAQQSGRSAQQVHMLTSAQQQLHQQQQRQIAVVAAQPHQQMANGLHQRALSGQIAHHQQQQFQLSHQQRMMAPPPNLPALNNHARNNYLRAQQQAQQVIQQQIHQQQQLASPPNLQSPPLRTSQITQNVTLHRTSGVGGGGRTVVGRHPNDRVPPLHQEQRGLGPPSTAEQQQQQQQFHQTQAQTRPPSSSYSFQIPLGSSTQVALVEVKETQVQPNSRMRTLQPRTKHQWHTPESEPLRPSGEPLPVASPVDNIKKVKISPQPSADPAAGLGGFDQSPSNPQRPSPSPVHHQQQLILEKPLLTEVQKKRPDANLIPTPPEIICKKEALTEEIRYEDVLSSLNELNRSLDRVDIASERPSIEDREDPHEDWCAACMDGGDLVCCDVCPKAFHHACHIPIITREEAKGDWQCLLCKAVDSVLSDAPGKLSSSEIKAACRLLLEIYCQYDASLHIRQPVSPQNTQYYEVVKQPICLDQIRDKLADNRYRSMTEFVSDVKLMFNNYYLYHPSEGSASGQIKSLEELFTSLLSRFLAEPAPSLASIKTEAMES